MADKSLEEIDAELAALEAELAALERGEAPPPKAIAPKEKKSLPKLPFGRKKEQPTDASAAPAPEEPKKRFGLKIPGRKAESAAPAPESASDAEPAPVTSTFTPAPAPAPVATTPARASGAIPPPPLEGATWQIESGVWRRIAPAAPPPVYRRTLDADGNVVEELPADDEEVRGTRPAPETPTREEPSRRFGLKLPIGKTDAPEPSNGETGKPEKKGLGLRFGKLGRKK